MVDEMGGYEFAWLDVNEFFFFFYLGSRVRSWWKIGGGRRCVNTSSVGGTTSAGATGKRGRRCAFLRNLDQRCLLAVTRRNACTMMPCTSVISHCLPLFPYHSTPYFARPAERERKREIDRERDPGLINNRRSSLHWPALCLHAPLALIILRSFPSSFATVQKGDILSFKFLLFPFLF